jgi:hypothetical protein
MAKVGLFGIGLDTYWVQFDGLLYNLKLPGLCVLSG